MSIIRLKLSGDRLTGGALAFRCREVNEHDAEESAHLVPVDREQDGVLDLVLTGKDRGAFKAGTTYLVAITTAE